MDFDLSSSYMPVRYSKFSCTLPRVNSRPKPLISSFTPISSQPPKVGIQVVHIPAWTDPPSPGETPLPSLLSISHEKAERYTAT
eukprot:456175-Amorphochlora_amoeboformis.AAC.1